MLLNLKIQNLILVQKAEISFGKGLNILTGETGSGKSAILTAIRLISGARSDSDWIGKHGDLSIVEACVSGLALPSEISPGEDPSFVLIRREIHRSGKSRCFINDHLIPLFVLKQTVGSFIEMIDQSSSHSLAIPEEQRLLFDTFIQILDEVQAFQISYQEEKTLGQKLEETIKEQETRSRNLDWAKEDLDLIEEVNWKEGEEEELASEHQILTHAQEIREKLESAMEIIEKNPLKRAASIIEHCARFDPELNTSAASLKNGSLEMEECARFLHSYLNKIESDPLRLNNIESRISSIEQLKRRFGKTAADVEKKRKELIDRIDRLSHLDEEQTDLQSSLEILRKKNMALANSLTDKRLQSAPLFAESIVSELTALNLPHARFILDISHKSMGPSGCDEVRFLFSANPGHPPLAIEECASGGELSRLLLAIKTVIAEKEQKNCLIFDEIDSNVGGQTASILGEKLRKIAAHSQVICITHFVQVAQSASHHFLVSKAQESGLATTKIVKLKEEERETEYQRMLGKIGLKNKF